MYNAVLPTACKRTVSFTFGTIAPLCTLPEPGVSGNGLDQN